MKITKVVKIYGHLDEDQACNIPMYGKDSLSIVIRNLQADVRRIKNESMRMSYDYDMNKYSYYTFIRQRMEELGNGEVHRITTTDFSKYASFDGYIGNAIAPNYANINKGIVSTLTRRVWGEYNSDKKQLISGEKSLRTYGADQPIPIRASDARLEKRDNFDYIFTIPLLSAPKKKELGMSYRSGIRFILDENTDSERAILDRLIAGEYKLTESCLSWDNTMNHRTKRHRGWVFSIGYSFEKDTANPDLDKDKILGVDLGVSNVLYLGWHGDDRFKKYIPGSEIKKFQRVEEKRKADIQRCRVARGGGSVGHGTRCAVKPLERQSHYIHNFKENKNWHYAHFVVDAALEGGFGTIQMEDLSGISKSEKFDRAWTFYSLQQKIEQLAAENGIAVKKVNPRNTSQMCSRCGYISSENRKSQSEFKCVACGYRKNADHNAAMNISKANIEQLVAEQRKRQGCSQAA